MATPHSTEQVEYRPIEGFPGYRVGNDGSVWSCKKPGYRGGHKNYWRQLKPDTLANGHKNVSLCFVGRRTRKMVHHLVLEAFCGPCPDGQEGCHENGKPWDNRLENLRWDTHTANLADRIKHGTAPRGSKSGNVKLTESRVLHIRRRHKKGERIIDLALEHNVKVSTIRAVVNRQNWSWLEDEDA